MASLPKDHPSNESVEPIRILIVDDEAPLRRSLQRNLARHYEVELAEDATGGLAMLASRGPIAVVLADFQMPGTDGLEMLTEAALRFPTTVRILYTGALELAAASPSMESAQLFRVLSKPASAQDLHAALRDAVEEHRRVVAALKR